MSINNKTKKVVITGIIVITLFEIYFAYKIVMNYAGVYQVGIFIPLILQPLFYMWLFRIERPYLKIRITIILAISIFLPLVIYFTLPNYTYNKGKEIVKQNLAQSENYLFTDLTYASDTIPVINNPKQLFVSNRVYYYEVTLKDEKKYFIINPLTGELKELARSYWGSN
ncbi:hypothetical protein [Candidatus Clostridium stratigraminis]|uniref:Uncharacterized protein n=1 Tax=Candidatus Clostridium stratigraminis TaxID=3381661 RepID=A0ABW8T0S9_9CLOT